MAKRHEEERDSVAEVLLDPVTSSCMVDINTHSFYDNPGVRTPSVCSRVASQTMPHVACDQPYAINEIPRL